MIIQELVHCDLRNSLVLEVMPGDGAQALNIRGCASLLSYITVLENLHGSWEFGSHMAELRAFYWC